MSMYELIAIINKRLKLVPSLYSLLQVLSLTLFEKTTLQEALHGAKPYENDTPSVNQLNLFKFLPGSSTRLARSRFLVKATFSPFKA